ncbi:hypothetical protein PZB74_18980 [Porifericola rhodea]|uniref:hypothetical protein n=1 Tax=Porifericola rhodea TaxID=930972 RepID=UPI002666F0DF|nr:hypothetical protein [Porifericola rhodea]WKN31037.1 hypothetical protein PZB74_18980 [Porifericola rhodea]
MKKLAIALFAGILMSSCYTNICPTYSVNPDKKIQKTQQVSVEQDKTEKASS